MVPTSTWMLCCLSTGSQYRVLHCILVWFWQALWGIFIIAHGQERLAVCGAVIRKFGKSSEMHKEIIPHGQGIGGYFNLYLVLFGALGVALAVPALNLCQL